MKSPFEGLTKFQINKLYDLLGVHIYKYNKNQEVIPTIKNDNIIGIVLEGSAQIINMEYNGNETIKENLNKDSVFGTNISATNSEYCQIIAKQDTEVLIIDYSRLMNPTNLKYKYFNVFNSNIFEIKNVKFREINERVKTLEKKQIREKLLEYFEIENKKTRLNKINLKITFKDLADYLAVDRSAMFRELKRLKDDKIIKIEDRKITLLYKDMS